MSQVQRACKKAVEHLLHGTQCPAAWLECALLHSPLPDASSSDTQLCCPTLTALGTLAFLQTVHQARIEAVQGNYHKGANERIIPDLKQRLREQDAANQVSQIMRAWVPNSRRHTNATHSSSCCMMLSCCCLGGCACLDGAWACAAMCTSLRCPMRVGVILSADLQGQSATCPSQVDGMSAAGRRSQTSCSAWCLQQEEGRKDARRRDRQHGLRTMWQNMWRNNNEGDPSGFMVRHSLSGLHVHGVLSTLNVEVHCCPL